MKKARDFLWFSQPYYWVAVAFLFSAFICSAGGQMRLVGMIMAGTAVVMQFMPSLSLRSGGGLSKDVRYYLIWGCWALLMGVLTYESWACFAHEARVLLQMMVLVSAGYAILFRMRDPRLFYFMMLFIGLLNIAMTLGYFQWLATGTVGDLATDMYVGAGYAVQLGDEGRLTAVGRNPNEIAFAYLASMWSLMMLYREDLPGLPRIVKMVVIGALMALFCYFILLTGSRKGTMVAGIIVTIWVMWAIPGKVKFTTVLLQILFAAVLVCVAAILIPRIMEDTYVGKRFQMWLDAGGGDAVEGFKENQRGELYRLGFQWWLESPIWGLGLGQFAARYGFYSHSDYIESLTCTGLVGFILYQMFAFSVVLRAIRFLMLPYVPEDIKYKAKCMLIFFVGNHYLIGIGAPHWCQMGHIFLIVFCSAYSRRIERDIKRLQGPARRIW